VGLGNLLGLSNLGRQSSKGNAEVPVSHSASLIDCEALHEGDPASTGPEPTW